MFIITAKIDNVSYSLGIANPRDLSIHDPLICDLLNTDAHVSYNLLLLRQVVMLTISFYTVFNAH